MENKKYELLQTKVSPETLRRIRAIERKKGLTAYGILQMMCDCIVRYMDDRHNLTPEMEQLMSLFEHMEGWRDALNLADPTADKEIGEATYFMFDPTGEKKGTRAVHVAKPFFGNWSQDENIQHILERTLCLLTPERYRRMRVIAVELGCSSQLELFDKFIDHFSKEEDLAELRRVFEDADRAENNRPVAYGERTRRKKAQHLNEQTDMFCDINDETDSRLEAE